jgi:hypothetical protein
MAAEKPQTLEDRVIVLAEQVGRLVGVVQRKIEGSLDQKALLSQVTQIRDEAAALLDHLGAGLASAGGTSSSRMLTRSGGTVDAPGKKHRKPAQGTRGVKHSDQTISKIAGAKTMRRGRRRG